MSEHHPESPSNFPKWKICSACGHSDVVTKDASDGTRAHKVLEWKLKGIPVPEDILTEMPEHDLEVVDWAVQKIRELSGTNPIRVEQRVDFNFPEGDILHGNFGTPDVMWFERDLLTIADFKLRSKQTMDYTSQGLGYAVAALSSILPSGLQRSLARIRVVILHGGNRVVEHSAEWTYARAEKEVRDIVTAHRFQPRPTVGEACKYCPDAKTCPDVAKTVAVVAPLETPNLPAAPQPYVERWRSLSLPQQAVIAKAVKTVADKILKDMREAVDKSELKEVKEGPITWFFKMRAGDSHVSDVVGLANLLVSRYNVKQEDFLALCEISRDKVIDLVYEKRTDKKITKKEIREVVSNYYVHDEPIPLLTLRK